MLDKIKRIRQELDELEKQIRCGDSPNELRQQISKLICCYRKDFKNEISTWKKMIEDRVCQEGYERAIQSFPYHVAQLYKETGLACSVDISTGTNYNQNLREQLTKLISRYGKVKVMVEICWEAKRVNILNDVINYVRN